MLAVELLYKGNDQAVGFPQLVRVIPNECLSNRWIFSLQRMHGEYSKGDPLGRSHLEHGKSGFYWLKNVINVTIQFKDHKKGLIEQLGSNNIPSEATKPPHRSLTI